MNNQTFLRRLINFFERHDPHNVGLAEKIAETYSGKEEAVFSTLNKFYQGKPSGVSREAVEQELSSQTPIMGPNTGFKMS